MKRGLLDICSALAALASAAAASGQPPAAGASPDDIAAVMTAALREFAGDQRYPHRRSASRSICVAAALGEPPLVGAYEAAGLDDTPMGEPPRPPRPETDQERRSRLWYVDPSDPDAAARRRIQDAALAVSLRPPGGPTPARVDAAWLAANQSLGESGCAERQRFSAPSIEGDVAFVEVQIDCGGLCGMMATVVLERRNGTWSVTDGRVHAVS